MFYAWGRNVSSKVKRQQLDKLADSPLLRTLLGEEGVAARRVLGPRAAVYQQQVGQVPLCGGPTSCRACYTIGSALPGAACSAVCCLLPAVCGSTGMRYGVLLYTRVLDAVCCIAALLYCCILVPQTRPEVTPNALPAL
jgi:hypothetical protein